MYPNFYYIFKDWFGLEIEALKLVNSFGFFVAMAFIAAYWVMVLELKRKEKEGLLKAGKKKIWIGKSDSPTEYITTGIVGFLFGWKIINVIINPEVIAGDPQAYIFSSNGSVLIGLITAAAMLGYRYYDSRKKTLKEPYQKEVDVHPFEYMGDITFIAAVFGIIGAKLFHILEYWEDFRADPSGMVFSAAGLTFYGGLLFGAIAVLWYANKKGIKPLQMLDVGAPAMMLSYGVGRIGCHVSGDGDWGIVNLTSKPNWLSWLPDWAWAYNYPNNVGKQCNPYTGAERLLHQCNWNETPFLIDPVYPTPLYEVVMSLALFAILWMLRKRLKVVGLIFFIYLIFNGLERFFIEKIRVNSTYNAFGMEFTQAELISSIFILTGIIGLIWLSIKHKKSTITRPNN